MWWRGLLGSLGRRASVHGVWRAAAMASGPATLAAAVAAGQPSSTEQEALAAETAAAVAARDRRLAALNEARQAFCMGLEAESVAIALRPRFGTASAEAKAAAVAAAVAHEAFRTALAAAGGAVQPPPTAEEVNVAWQTLHQLQTQKQHGSRSTEEEGEELLEEAPPLSEQEEFAALMVVMRGWLDEKDEFDVGTAL